MQIRFMERAAAQRRRISRRIPAELRSCLDADDVLQEVWIVVMQRFRFFRPDGPGSFDRWVDGIVRRRLLTALRKATNRQRHEANGPAAEGLLEGSPSVLKTPSSACSAKEMRESVEAAIQGLPPQAREVARGVYFDDLSLPEVAKVLGITLKQARHQIEGIQERMSASLRSYQPQGDTLRVRCQRKNLNVS